MPLYNIPNMTSGMDETLIDVVKEVSIFTPMLLSFIFFVIFIGGSISQKRRSGISDMPLWATLGSIGTLLVALPLTLSVGLIDMFTLGVVVSITILSGLWLFLDKSRQEV